MPKSPEVRTDKGSLSESKSDSEYDSESENNSELDSLETNIINSQILDSKDYIDIYMVNRSHIREQSKAVIPACGVLLTGAFGLLYFIFNANGDRIQISSIIIISIVIAAIILAASILSSIKSVQSASPSEELPKTRDQLWDFIYDIYNEEYKWGTRSIWLLGISLILLIFIIIYFAYSYLYGTSLNNAAMTHIPNIIIIPFPGSL